MCGVCVYVVKCRWWRFVVGILELVASLEQVVVVVAKAVQIRMVEKP
jgi:hypothetical protein